VGGVRLVNLSERPERTVHGHRRFRCRSCGRQFNERSLGVGLHDTLSVANSVLVRMSAGACGLGAIPFLRGQLQVPHQPVGGDPGHQPRRSRPARLGSPSATISRSARLAWVREGVSCPPQRLHNDATEMNQVRRLARRSWAGVADHAAAARADRLAVGGVPAQAQEHVLDAAVRHTHDLGGAERACRRG
jgi:hypothetical protein